MGKIERKKKIYIPSGNQSLKPSVLLKKISLGQKYV